MPPPGRIRAHPRGSALGRGQGLDAELGHAERASSAEAAQAVKLVVSSADRKSAASEERIVALRICGYASGRPDFVPESHHENPIPGHHRSAGDPRRHRSRAGFFFGGFYNVAASEDDPDIVNWGARACARRLDRAPCDRSTPPVSLDDPALVQAGAQAPSPSAAASIATAGRAPNGPNSPKGSIRGRPISRTWSDDLRRRRCSGWSRTASR